jgi:tetratricopeptide (TPR) repeat protein
MINVLNQMMTQGSLVFRSGHWVLDDGLKTVARFVPPTIQQIIEKQLESCTSDEQELLKAASVEGVEFSAAGIASAIGGRVEKIMDTFQSLARRNQFIQVTKYGGVRTVRYKFVHSLYQQTFYQLLSEKTRVQYHRRIAECIGKTKDNREEMASLLAMHLDRGGNSWKAVQYYLKAAEKANSRYAGHDASELAARGLRLLSDIPESPDRIELEVQLHNSLGDSMISARGLGSKEVKLAFSTSRFLFRKLSVRRQSTRRSLLFRALYGLWSYHWVHAEYAAALDLAMRMMQLAEIDHDPDMLDHAHYALGWLLMDHGDFVAALKHLRKSHNVYGHSLAALALWNLGHSDRALANLEKILVRDCETGNMKHGMFARLIIARVYMERRDIEKALEHSKTAFDLAIDHKFGEPWLAYIRSLYGWALAKIGQSEKGIEQIQYALDEIRAYGSSDLKPLFMGLYSDLLLNGERIDDGLAAVDEALDSASSTGINYMDAELHRLRGELLFQKIGLDNIQDPNNSQVSEILFYFETAIIVARKQGAKALELRATISLAKFLQKLNRQKEAYKRLKRISSWFTEGLEAADYCEALHLLKELK